MGTPRTSLGFRARSFGVAGLGLGVSGLGFWGCCRPHWETFEGVREGLGFGGLFEEFLNYASPMYLLRLRTPSLNPKA